MNELRLKALRCPQCGAPGAVREGTRISRCDRCGVGLSLRADRVGRYEVRSLLDAAGAAECARAWLSGRHVPGTLGRPEPLLVPFHEIAGRRVGVFERKVPRRHRVQQVTHMGSQGPEFESKWVREEIEDTKVLLSDVQWLAAAARTPWRLDAFDANAARRAAELVPFDLVDAQRRATVFAAETDPADLAERRFGGSDASEIVALGRRTLFFPFWVVPLTHEGGGYEVMIDGLFGSVVAWRLPAPEPRVRWTWAALAIPGSLALGAGLQALGTGAGTLQPGPLLSLGAGAVAAALWWSRPTDAGARIGPEPGTAVAEPGGAETSA